MVVSAIDELNILSASKDDLRKMFNDFFMPMIITDEEKKARVDTALILFEIFTNYFEYAINFPDRSEEELRNQLYYAIYTRNTQKSIDRYTTKIINENVDNIKQSVYVTTDNYFIEYVDKIAHEIDSSIKEHINDPLKMVDGEEGVNYYTSTTRAFNLAQNESNTINNYEDVIEYKNMGYTSKTWLTMEDNRVRTSHVIQDGITIPIDDYFVFDDCIMFMPHDVVNGTPDQLANCRCSIQFN